MRGPSSDATEVAAGDTTASITSPLGESFRRDALSSVMSASTKASVEA